MRSHPAAGPARPIDARFAMSAAELKGSATFFAYCVSAFAVCEPDSGMLVR